MSLKKLGMPELASRIKISPKKTKAKLKCSSALLQVPRILKICQCKSQNPGTVKW